MLTENPDSEDPGSRAVRQAGHRGRREEGQPTTVSLVSRIPFIHTSMSHSLAMDSLQIISFTVVSTGLF